MAKFKKGNVVRVVSDNPVYGFGEQGVRKGSVGTITEVVGSRIFVDFPCHQGWIASSADIAVVSPKSVSRPFKVGQRVKCIYNDNGTKEFVGETGFITKVKAEDKYPYLTSFCSAGLSDQELEAYEVNFILQYELDKDPFETFATLEEVHKRIKELAKRTDLKRDSISVYEIARTFDVQLDTRVLFGDKVSLMERVDDSMPEILGGARGRGFEVRIEGPFPMPTAAPMPSAAAALVPTKKRRGGGRKVGTKQCSICKRLFKNARGVALHRARSHRSF